MDVADAAPAVAGELLVFSQYDTILTALENNLVNGPVIGVGLYADTQLMQAAEPVWNGTPGAHKLGQVN